MGDAEVASLCSSSISCWSVRLRYHVGVYGWLRIQARDGANCPPPSCTLPTGNCCSVQLVRESYGIGVVASGINNKFRLLIPMDVFGKAALRIIIFSYVGNYFWTYNCFTVLGASYTFPSSRMASVPPTTCITRGCFLFYHVMANMTLRRLRHAVADFRAIIQWVNEVAWILGLGYFIVYMEAFAITNFPDYQFVGRASMDTAGSLFYAIYFIASLAMSLRADENPDDPLDIPRVAVDALGAAMLVTIILNLWRLFLGLPTWLPKRCPQPGRPWFPGHA